MQDAPTRALMLPSGRSVEIEAQDRGERMTVVGPEGSIELRVRFTAAGPVLEFSAAAISLRVDGELALDCERLRINARGDVSLATQGNLEQQVAGDRSVCVSGESSHEARHVELLAREGDLELRAENDALVDGKRVLINS